MVTPIAALAAFKLNTPVRLSLSLSDNMKIVGKRPEFLFAYSASLDGDNKVDRMAVDVVSDAGYSGANPEGAGCGSIIRDTMYLTNNPVETTTEDVMGNKPTTTPVRAPTTPQAYGVVETIMEHLAVTSGQDPVDFRASNIKSQHPLPELITQLKEQAGYDDRRIEIETYNSQNKWKKRGLGFTPIAYEHGVGKYLYSVQVAIYERDATINVTHGGIEIGQGVNTKVAQVVARGLGLPDLSLIKVCAANTFVANNNNWTGGSQASDHCCYAAEKAVQELVDRMSEFTDESGNNI